MRKSNSHMNTTSHFDAPSKKGGSPKECDTISVQKEYRWTANVSFVFYKSEQRDKAYRDWVKVFLQTLK